MKHKIKLVLLAVGLCAGSTYAFDVSVNGFPDSIDIPKDGSKECTSPILRQVDLDHDGLLDCLSVYLNMESSSSLNDNRIKTGGTLKISVDRVEYTLASGTCGTGKMKRFCVVELESPDRISINGRKQEMLQSMHDVGKTGNMLKLKALGTETLELRAIGMEVEIDPADPELGNKSNGNIIFLKCLLPLFILFLRKGKK